MTTPIDAADALRASDRMRIRTVRSPAALAPYTDAWQALADATAEENVFYEPWALLAALEAYDPGGVVEVDLALDDGGRLHGVMPVQRTAGVRGLPVPTLAMWNHPHAYFTAPLVRQGWEPAVADAWRRDVRRRSHPAACFHLAAIDPSGPMWRALARPDLHDAPASFIAERYARPFWCRGKGAPTGHGRKRRRNLRRLARRLAEVGRVDHVVVSDPGRAEAYAESFLRMEAAGWKGRKGSALLRDPRDARFLRDLIRGGAAAGRFRGHALRLNGAPIALAVDFLGRRGGSSFKVTYDERWSRFSPGLLLEQRILEHMERDEQVDWLDSCAGSHAEALRALWPEERSVVEVVLSTGSAASRGLVTALSMARRARRWIRGQEPAPHDAEGS